MNDAPTVSLASEDPRSTDLEYRLLRMAWDLEAHFLTLYNVAEIPIYIRRNSLDRQGPLGVLRARPVESSPVLIPTMVTSPARDAEERDVGSAGPKGLEGLRQGTFGSSSLVTVTPTAAAFDGSTTAPAITADPPPSGEQAQVGLGPKTSRMLDVLGLRARV